MESARAHQGARPGATSSPGELIVQSGRQAGARRPLGAPTTFLGRHNGCDIRLNVDGVDPMHCALVAGPEGLQIRDFGSTHGTFVNGNRVEIAWLQHGDILNVGPFQFRLELTARITASAPSDQGPAEQIHEALRIQTAAVAAQQIALDEEEARLQHRRHDLEQQEQQLADHLAQKQRQVQIWSEYAAAERETLHKEKLQHEKQLAQQSQELLQARQGLTQEQQHNLRERQRIAKVYQRLRQRWQRQGAAERDRRQAQTLKLQTESQTLQERQATLAAQETALAQEVLRFNADRELFARQTREQRDSFAEGQQAWRRRRSQELTALKSKELAVVEGFSKLHKAGVLLLQEKVSWEQQQSALQKELHGLNNRIVHQRMRLQEQEEELGRLHAAVRERTSQRGEPGPIECEVEVLADAAPPQMPSGQHRLAHLDGLAGELADQRAHLIEQYTRLAQLHDAWQQQRDQAADELDALAHRLATTEETLSERDRQTILIEEALRERAQEIEAAQQELQIWRAQWKSHEAMFTHEHQTLMAALRQKDTLLQEQLADLIALRQRWNLLRKQEVEGLRIARALADQQQRDTHQLRVELFGNSQKLESEKRVLAEKSLALEQYRQEVFFRAHDPAAQRRVERLRRRWLGLNAGVIRTAKNERETVEKELLRLQTERAELAEHLNQRLAADTNLAEKQTALEEQDALLKQRRLHLDHELKILEQRSPEHRTQNEVETLAQIVYQDDTSRVRAA